MEINGKTRAVRIALILAAVLVSGVLAAGAGFKGGQWINQLKFGGNGGVKAATGKVDANDERKPVNLPIPTYKKRKLSGTQNMDLASRRNLVNRGSMLANRGGIDFFSELIDINSYYLLIKKDKGKNLPGYQDIPVPEITAQFMENRETYLHKGIDIGLPVGTDVKTILAGKLYKGNEGQQTGFGRYVYIVHENGLVSYYGHLSTWADIADGTPVAKGRVIGRSGNGGDSTGPHLHFEVRKDGQAVNPLPFLK